jgi:hypothetical protein
VLWGAVIVRLFTDRFDLPHKPWLALAFLIVPHTGEVFFNVTNLQWIMAFVLLQQAIIAPPRTARERTGDLAILALVSLTGPFAIAFAPLFVWRWWRGRHADNLAALGVVLLGSAVQAWFIVRTGPKFDFQSAPFHLGPNLVVLARRVVLWPVLGRELTLGLSAPAVGALGGGVLAALAGWALRPHPLRTRRLEVLAAFGLITLAGIYRSRPDTWQSDNLEFGDRYFYIPRVLFVWLMIWEFDATSRFVRTLARIAFLALIAFHVWSYPLPAPKNYHWRDHVEPIRRGVPANIPILPEDWTLEYRGRPEGRR